MLLIAKSGLVFRKQRLVSSPIEQVPGKSRGSYLNCPPHRQRQTSPGESSPNISRAYSTTIRGPRLTRPHTKVICVAAEGALKRVLDVRLRGRGTYVPYRKSSGSSNRVCGFADPPSLSPSVSLERYRKTSVRLSSSRNPKRGPSTLFTEIEKLSRTSHVRRSCGRHDEPARCAQIPEWEF